MAAKREGARDRGKQIATLPHALVRIGHQRATEPPNRFIIIAQKHLRVADIQIAVVILCVARVVTDRLFKRGDRVGGPPTAHQAKAEPIMQAIADKRQGRVIVNRPAHGGDQFIAAVLTSEQENPGPEHLPVARLQELRPGDEFLRAPHPRGIFRIFGLEHAAVQQRFGLASHGEGGILIHLLYTAKKREQLNLPLEKSWV